MADRKRWDGDAGNDHGRGIGPLEHELTLHIARAHELAERAKRSNDAVRAEIERARAIADDLSGRLDEKNDSRR